MAAFRLTTKARADLRAIGRYTQRTWGQDQRNRYLSRFDEAFHLLAREPDRGRSCDDSARGTANILWDSMLSSTAGTDAAFTQARRARLRRHYQDAYAHEKAY
jgi:plasmid stabilization system protein ParE